MLSMSPDPKPANASQDTGLLARVQQLPVLRHVRINSISTKLFLSVMVGTLVGIGGITFLFEEIIKYQTEDRIQQSVNDKVRLIDSRLDQAETLANVLKSSILTLHVREAQTEDTYRRLIFELFKERPQFVVGLGMGQSENGILAGQDWFSAYYYLDSGTPDAEGELLPPPHDSIRFVDGTLAGTPYQESDRFQTYFEPQQNVWAPVEGAGAQSKTTFYSQIFDNQNNWLGTTFVEVNSSLFDEALASLVIQNAGFFALINETGQVLSYPAAGDAADPSGAVTVPGLDAVLPQMNQESGIIEGPTGYWAYEQVPETNLRTLAFVPYSVVFGQVTLITVGGFLVAGLLIVLGLHLTVRSLNRRLRPMLEECNRLAGNDADMLAYQQHQDEIGQIAVSFYNALEHLRSSQEQILQEAALGKENDQQLKQMAIAEQINQALQTDLEAISTVMDAVGNGDFTREAQTHAEPVLSVAETLNRLTNRLGQVMAIALNASQQVARGTTQLEALVSTVVDRAQQQTQSVDQIQTLVGNMDVLSQEAALQASKAVEAVQVSQSATQKGQQEIKSLFEGIGTLQQSTDQIAKRIQTLTSYVELAAQFAKDQKRIASMTRILAVNASMLANRAAVQQDPEQFSSITREFETVAAQVNDLAAQTNQSLVLLQQRTDQIQTTVSGLDHDVQEIGQQVDQFTTNVDQSNQLFDTIGSASQQVNEMGQQVLQSSQTIAQASQTALKLVRTMMAIASETSNQAGTTQTQTRQLEKVAQALLQTLDFFKLQAQHLQSAHADPVLAAPAADAPFKNGQVPSDHPSSNPITIAASQPER